MTMDSLEKRIEVLERELGAQRSTIEKQQHELQRVAAFNECMNLMNKYEYLISTKGNNEVLGLFALKSPDVRAEIANWGAWEGPDAVRALYAEVHRDFGQTPGSLAILTNTTQVFEVAADGMTAKAVWICPGIETMAPPDGSKPLPNWSWAKRAVDFIKEDGAWKIWHYHVYGLFCTPFGTSWVDAPPPFWNEMPLTLPEEQRPNKATTHPLWMYSVTAVPERVPAPPEPYDTFDETTAY